MKTMRRHQRRMNSKRGRNFISIRNPLSKLCSNGGIIVSNLSIFLEMQTLAGIIEEL